MQPLHAAICTELLHLVDHSPSCIPARLDAYLVEELRYTLDHQWGQMRQALDTAVKEVFGIGLLDCTLALTLLYGRNAMFARNDVVRGMRNQGFELRKNLSRGSQDRERQCQLYGERFVYRYIEEIKIQLRIRKETVLSLCGAVPTPPRASPA
jgi:hypothetical protein